MKKISILFSLFIMFLPISVTSANEESERVIITFNESIDEAIIADPRVKLHHTFERYHAVSATIPVTMQAELSRNKRVEMIEVDPIVMIDTQHINWGMKTVRAVDAHASGFTGKGVKIGIIDSGIYVSHPDLAIAGGVSFIDASHMYNDEDGHGTHVAGIIGARDNQEGSIGVAPDAQLYAIKAIGANGIGNQSDVVKGIEWAAEKRLDIVNLSITTTQKSTIMERAFNEAYEKGLLIIAAAGNAKTPLKDGVDVLYPARFPSVIAVGSINAAHNRSLFSYFGPSLEFVAPGEEIYSTYIPSKQNELYALGSGTSMATPYVTGVAALYKEAYPHVNNKEIRALMHATAIDLGEVGKDPLFGYGVVQAPTEQDKRVFPDIPNGSWYEEEIGYLYEEKIITGYTDGKFYPNEPVTRAAAITMIGKALKLDGNKQSTPYTDVLATHYASGFIKSATDAAIINGLPDKSFKPYAEITRADVAIMLQNAFHFQTEPTSRYIDMKKGTYYDEAVHLLKGAKITTGYLDGTYRPLNKITRSEFAALLARSLDDIFRR